MSISPRKILLGILAIAFVAAFFLMRNFNESTSTETVSSNSEVNKKETPSTPFVGGKFKTDTSKHSIPLNKVLSGGPGKDGIPALVSLSFTSAEEASKWLPADADGIVVSIDGITRFYPFNVLVWHEIANDVIADTPIVVTFCPLCGSAIVFDARVDGTREYFGVSGSLYESNLLMYDVTTESLWSQIIGEAVVGEHTGKKLSIVPSQVMTFADVQKQYESVEVLSKNTGFNRNYNQGPYGNYNENDKLYFPISITDTRLPTKEVMYIVNYREKSVAFQRNKLSAADKATVSVGDTVLTASIVDGEILVTDAGGATIPGYTAMWFSWAIHHQKDGVVWSGF